MSYPRLAARLYNTPLLITPDKAEVIERVFRAHVEGTAPSGLPKIEVPQRPDLFTAAGALFSRTQGGYARSNDGIALIQVLGTLVQRGSGMDAMSGLESYDNIGAQIAAAISDPLVHGILLEIDSNGGEAPGLFNLAAQVRAANEVKPVVAHANEQAFSAAYALASAAGDLFVADTGMVGSVGVIMLHVDQSQQDAKRGLVYTPIFAGARKNDYSPHEPLTDAALAHAQDMANRLYSTFVDHVASMRNVDAQTVRDTEAALLHPDQALDVEFIDGVATLAQSMNTLRERITKPATRASRAAGARKGASMTTEKSPAAPAMTATAEQLAAERQAARTAAETELTPKLTAQGASAERTRMKAITTCEAAKDRALLAAHLAYDTDMTAEAAQAVLAKAAKETPDKAANPLAAAMASVPNANVGVAGEGAGGDKVVKLNATDIYARRGAGGNLRVVR